MLGAHASPGRRPGRRRDDPPAGAGHRAVDGGARRRAGHGDRSGPGRSGGRRGGRMSYEEASFDEIAAEQSPQDVEVPTRHGRRRALRKHSALRGALPVLLVVLVLVGATVCGVTGYRWLTSNVSVESEEADFPGPGRGEAVVEVASGDTGTDIARTLVDEIGRASGRDTNAR